MKLKDLMLSVTPMLAAILATTWSHGAFAQNANQTLSNLTSPTAINQSLLVNADNTYTLGGSGDAWSYIYSYNVNTGNVNATDVYAASSVNTTNVTGAGTMQISAQSVASGTGYAIDITAGATTDTSTSVTGGDISITGGAGPTTGGNVSITGGANNSTLGSAGDIFVVGGLNSAAGVPGSIYLQVGDADPTIDKVRQLRSKIFAIDIFAKNGLPDYKLSFHL